MAKMKQDMSWSPTKYDVFISFRGEDVRISFISHLRSAIDRGNIKWFADDGDLQKGDEVWTSLSQAIQDSKLAIVVFSENYADSKWCLNELVQILHCRKTQGLVVIPVFYHVDPSHVRKYSGAYGEAISKHETFFGDKHKESIQMWKAALAEAANISGWDTRSRDYKNESEVIEKIVEDVTEKLTLRSPVELEVEHLVEIEKNCEEVKLLLSKNQKIGIWGMGGIGKTTIAKALFSQLFPQYDGVCFLANVREESKRIGQISLCDKLLSGLLKEGHHKYNLAGSTFILRRLSNKKVLIVLDDVDSLDQLDDLCKQCNYARPDSKLIITTRDKHLLSGRVNKIYEVKTWNIAKSMELFSLHAFKEKLPKEGFEDLSKRAVTYAGGVPLALKVLGSNLYSRSTEFWDSELSKLMNCPNDRIQNVLQVSYDGLDELQQKIFLDIAFFFKGENKGDVIRILDACGFFATSGVKVLQDKALINISYSGTIQMHDLIQEMGLNIVRQGSEDPGKRSRLRDVEEVSDVLENKKGSDIIEGIILDLSSIKDLRLNAETFNNMTKLRIVRLYAPSGKRSRNVHHSGVLSKLSGKLRYLEWNGCPFKSLPVTFCAKMLVEIRMQHSHVAELWQGVQDVANLVGIDLSESKYLKNLPDLSKAPNLGWVNLSGCESLSDVHPSVFSSDSLETLILDGCKKVKSLKSEKHLASLRKISVNGCTSLREFAVSSDSITSLDLSSTGIEILDSLLCPRNLLSLHLPCLGHGIFRNGLSFPKHLVQLSVCNCRVAIDKMKLHVLFDDLTSLQILQLKNCCILYELPDNISCLSKLYDLRLDGSCVKTLPTTIKLLRNLRTLSLENCRKLESIPELPPNVTQFNAENCSSLGTISTLTSFACMTTWNSKFISFMNCVGLDELSLHCIMESAHIATISAMFLNMLVKQRYSCSYNNVQVCLPGSRVPGQFKYRTTDSSITVNLPSSESDLVGLTLCVVLSPFPGMKKVDAKICCQCYFLDGTRLGPVTSWNHKAARGLNSDHVYMWCDPFHFNSILKIYRYGERRVSFEFFVTNGTSTEEHVTMGILECGVCVIFDSQGDLHHLLGGVDDWVVGLEMGSHHGTTSMATAASDVTNNHEQHLSEHCSCSGDCSVEKYPNAAMANKEDSKRKRAQDQDHSQEKNKEEKGLEKEQIQNVQPTSSTKTSGSLSQIDLEMLEMNPFSMLDIWSTNSLSSHGSEACLNTATTDEANLAMVQFQELAFEGDFKIKLSTPGFKTKLQEVVGKLENLGKSIPETFKDKVEGFTNIFNQAFEANKKHNTCIKTIEEIEASTQEDRSKLAQAKEEYSKLQKTFQEIDQCLPNLVESEQKLVKEEEEITKQLKSVQHKLNAIRKQQEDIKAAKLATKEKQENCFSLAKHITSLLKNQLQEKKKWEQEQIDSEKALHSLLEAYTNLKVVSEFNSLHI